MRIEKHPLLEFNKGERVTFQFNGKTIEGYRGEPVAAALHAAGIRVLSHSLIHHRPRGFWCAVGNCSSCNMRVNGVPNVRVCVEPLQEGMIVEAQKGKGELNA
jgi:ferredoxin